MLDIAEHTLLRIATELKAKSISIKDLYRDFVEEATYQGAGLQVLS
jgi:hypothetical protein